MFGEAVVITNPCIEEGFRHMMKQKGGMLAKGWLLGLQFDALLEDDLYMTVARQANVYAGQIRETLTSLGYKMLIDSGSHELYYFKKDRISQTRGPGFLPEDISRVFKGRK